MTTISILSLFASCLAGYAVIELVMWLLEAVFASVKYIVCWIINKPCSWKRSYLEIRIIFSWLLKWVSFAELTPAQIYKHRYSIEAYIKSLVIRKNKRKTKRHEHGRKLMNKLYRSKKEP